jgi:chaperonin cofactor prefoldin
MSQKHGGDEENVGSPSFGTIATTEPVGAPLPAQAPASDSSSVGAKGSSGFVGGALKAGVLGAIVFVGYEEVTQVIEQQGVLQSKVLELQEQRDRADQRFSDFQTTISSTSQQQARSTAASVESLRGNAEEKLVNMRSRLGRIENSLEALRQEGVKDRQSFSEELKSFSSQAAGLQVRLDELTSSLGGLVGRLDALEDVLEGGLSTGGAPGPSGKAPSWAGTLTDLKDASAGNRWAAVTALGDTGDERVVPYLLPMLDDEDVFVRMAAARVLGELNSLEASSSLVDALGDKQAAVREAAVVSLRQMSGQDFRFDPLGNETERAKSQAAWRKWASQQKGG